MALRKRVWRTIKENKGRYIGIVVLIFFGSFAFVAMSGLAANLSLTVGGFADSHLQEDAAFSTTTPLDVPTVERASNAAIDFYLSCDATVNADDPLPIRLLSAGSKVNIPAILTGDRLPETGEVLFDPGFMAAHGLEAGRRIDIDGRPFTITGTAALPHYMFILRFENDVLPPSGYGFGIVSEDDFVHFPAAQTVYSVRFNDRDNIRSQTMNLSRMLRESGYSVFGQMSAENNNRMQMPRTQAAGVGAASGPLSAMLFLIACIIVGVVIGRSVKADGVIIGTLYSQGYRRRELLRHYLSLPLLLAVVGGILGVLAGQLLVSPAMEMLLTFYNVPFTGATHSFVDMLIGVLMPVAFLGFTSFLVIYRELKKTPAELMKGDSGKTKVNFLERAFKLERFWFQAKFQLREQMRSVSRLLFLLLGIMFASAFMLLGFTLDNSFNAAFSIEDDTFDIVIEYSFNALQTGDIPNEAEPFNALLAFPPGREAVQFYVMGILPDSAAVNLRNAAGDRLDFGGVNITKPLASRLRVGIGDTVAFSDTQDGVIYSLVINGIVETNMGQFIFLPLERFNEMTGMAQGSYSGLLSSTELDIDPALLSGVKDMRLVSEGLGDMAGSMMAMIAVLTIFAGIIAVVIIFLVTSLIIEESKQTISMLNVFGYKRKEIARLILNSSTWVVIAGFVLGIPVMLAVATAVFTYMGEIINMVLPMRLNPLHVPISFAILFAVYFFTKMLCGRKLARISMSEALKSGAE